MRSSIPNRTRSQKSKTTVRVVRHKPVGSASKGGSIKLQKHLAAAGIASRRAAEELISLGKVMVNGQPATIGQRIIPGKDRVKIGGKQIESSDTELIYFLVNKPLNLVSTTSDELGRANVLALLPADITKKYRLFPVGRLDKDSEGLMLLTNDGTLTNQLTHPRYQVAKTYLALIDREPTDLALNRLQHGVQLAEGMTSDAEVELLYEWREGLGISEQDFYGSLRRMERELHPKTSDETEPNRTSTHDMPIWLMVTIHEGRYHQVRRMLERVGYDTLRLIRVALGPYTLDELRGRPFKRLSEPRK